MTTKRERNTNTRRNDAIAAIRRVEAQAAFKDGRVQKSWTQPNKRAVSSKRACRDWRNG